jgi:hypothetical protein
LLHRKIARTSADNKNGDGLTTGTADFGFVLMDDACQRQVIHLNVTAYLRGLVRGRRIVLGISFKNPKSDLACNPDESRVAASAAFSRPA